MNNVVQYSTPIDKTVRELSSYGMANLSHSVDNSHFFQACGVEGKIMEIQAGQAVLLQCVGLSLQGGSVQQPHYHLLHILHAHDLKYTTTHCMPHLPKLAPLYSDRCSNSKPHDTECQDDGKQTSCMQKAY